MSKPEEEAAKTTTEKPEKPSAKVKLRIGLVLAGLSLPVLASGAIGVKLGSDGERDANRNDLAAAARYRRCADTVDAKTAQGGNVVRLGSLSSKEQSDCGYDFSYLASQIQDQSLGQGASVAEADLSSVRVRLPDVSDLREDARGRIASAHDFSHWGEVADGGMGVMFSFEAEALTIMGIGWVMSRRQKELSPEVT